jgi:hypothetical protein
LVYKSSEITTKTPQLFTKPITEIKYSNKILLFLPGIPSSFDYEISHELVEKELKMTEFTPFNEIDFTRIGIYKSEATLDEINQLDNVDLVYYLPFYKRDLKCPNEQECITNTFNCSNHGICIKKGDCFQCECSKKYTDDNGNQSPLYSGHYDWIGDNCSSLDISTTFHIIFWISLFLVLILIGSLYMMLMESESKGIPGSFAKQKIQ